MGVLLTVLTAIVTGLRRRKVTEAMVYELGTPEGVPTLERIMDAVAGILVPMTEAAKVAVETVRDFISLRATVECDFDKGLKAVVELVKKALGLTYVNPDVFKIEWSWKGLQNLDMALFHFNRNMSTDAAEKEMDDAGYRPANIAELLFFALFHPELFLSYPLVALGSQFGDYSPCLYGWCGGHRSLSLHLRGGAWYGFSRSLGVRK
ncbi:MAG: hypothetical protein WC764_02795 [Candidatus Paceibacterota bacterium]|jgi:hypothetical protein